MTYITSRQVKDIVHFSGYQIRLFLGNAEPAEFAGEAKKAIIAFHQNPSEFSDEALLEKGANIDDAHQYNVRIELRGISPTGAAQVVAKGIWGKARQGAIKVLRREVERHKDALLVRTAGSSSFEFNRAGVDKSLPLRYLRAQWQEILDQMKYVPGELIDSRRNHIVIASDGDGTIYEGPKTTHLPGLKDSPAYAEILTYIRAGGIFVLVSGNDLNRTFKRMTDGLPKELYSRVLLAANGGADLACLSPEGKPIFFTDYRKNALDVVANDIKQPALDIVYIGDDDSADGNDRPGFLTVGPERAVVVKALTDTKIFLEKWLHERKIYSA